MVGLARDVRADPRGYKVTERQAAPLAEADAIFPVFARTRRLDFEKASLRAGTIAGAALDAFEIEPLPACHPLFAMDNVPLCSHSANSILRAIEALHTNML